MGLIKNKEAVWIDDGVWDINGVLVGWLDATDEVPSDKNFEAKYMIYKAPVDSSRSWIYKFLGGIGKLVMKFSNDKSMAERFGFSLSPEPIPKPAINGFPDGRTIDGFTKSSDAPDKRVIIEEDLYGNAPYAEKVWGREGGESVAKYKDRIEELEQRLKAEEGKTSELQQEVEREEKDNRGRRNDHMDLYPDDQMGVE